MVKLTNKTKIKEQLKKYSERSSISDEVIETFDTLILRLLHGLIQLDNQELTPNSRKTLTKKEIEKAISLFSQDFNLKKLMDIDVENEHPKERVGQILLNNKELDINLNLSIDIENGDINVEEDS